MNGQADHCGHCSHVGHALHVAHSGQVAPVDQAPVAHVAPVAHHGLHGNQDGPVAHFNATSCQSGSIQGTLLMLFVTAIYVLQRYCTRSSIW